MGLHHACKSESKGHDGHRRAHGPKAHHGEHLFVRRPSTQFRDRIGHDCEIEHDIGTEEGEVSVGGGKLCAVGVIVDRRQRVQKAPYTCTKESHHRATD
ncbi:hypothetical protein FQZ97_1236920 [compost metagenome]